MSRNQREGKFVGKWQGNYVRRPSRHGYWEIADMHFEESDDWPNTFYAWLWFKNRGKTNKPPKNNYISKAMQEAHDRL
jgi:hypothetical protein